MSDPIYMLYLIRRKEAWYRLPAEEKAKVSAKTVEATREAGGKRLILCDSTWSDSRCEFFELTLFPSMAAVQRRVALYEEGQIFRFYEIRTVLGIEMEHE